MRILHPLEMLLYGIIGFCIHRALGWYAIPVVSIPAISAYLFDPMISKIFNTKIVPVDYKESFVVGVLTFLGGIIGIGVSAVTKDKEELY